MAYAEALHPLTVFELDKGFYNWKSESDASCPDYWAPVGLNKIMLYPKVAASLGSGVTLEILYLDGEPKLTSDASYVDLGDEEVAALVGYAQWVLSIKQGLKEGFILDEPLKDLFLTAAKRRGSWLQTTAAYRRYMGQARDENQPERLTAKPKGVRG